MFTDISLIYLCINSYAHDIIGMSVFIRVLGKSSTILVYRELSFTLRSEITDVYMIKGVAISLQFRVYRIFQGNVRNFACLMDFYDNLV